MAPTSARRLASLGARRALAPSGALAASTSVRVDDEPTVVPGERERAATTAAVVAVAVARCAAAGGACEPEAEPESSAVIPLMSASGPVRGAPRSSALPLARWAGQRKGTDLGQARRVRCSRAWRA